MLVGENWGSTSDVDDHIADSCTGSKWKVPLLIHAYSNGYPYVYQRDSSVSSNRCTTPYAGARFKTT